MKSAPSRRLAACLLACLWLCAAGTHAAGEPVLSVLPGQGDYAVGPALAQLDDATAALRIEDVASTGQADGFRPVGGERVNEGFTRSVLWFRLSVDLTAGAGRNWYLVEGNPLLDEVTLYAPDEAGGWQALRLGDTLPFGERPLALREHVMPLPPSLLAARQPVTVYLRVAGQGALNLAPRLVDGQALAERVSTQQWAFGLFYGAMGILFLYNLFVFVVARERAQLHYCVWLAGFILLFLSLNGVGLQYLWPQLPDVNGWFPLFTGMALVGALNFTRIFLDLDRDTPRLARAFALMVRVILALMVVGVLLPRQLAYILGNLLPLVFAVVMLVAGIVRLRQGYRAARLFVAGWGVLLLGAILLPLAALGLLPLNTVTHYSTQFGAVVQGILLSLALGDRLRLLKVENERMQAAAQRQQEETFAQLAALDADKMRFLQYLGRELNAPVGWLGDAVPSNLASAAPQVRALVDSVEAGRQRMMDLVATVLGYFDLAAETPGRAPLSAVSPMWLVDDLLRALAPEIAARGLRVTNRVPADLVLTANPRRLQRALETLLDNAVRFSDADGEIEVSGGLSGGTGYVVVRDGGRGIDAEHLVHLFDPFFTGASRHRDGGFGLSLAIARLLVHHMGGDLRADSPGRGRGAVFTLSLPAAAPAAGRPDPARSPAG